MCFTKNGLYLHVFEFKTDRINPMMSLSNCYLVSPLISVKNKFINLIIEIRNRIRSTVTASGKKTTHFL